MNRVSVKKKCETPSDLAKMATGLETVFAKFQPGEYRITIERVDRERTTEQSRFYWALLREIEEKTGQDADDLHQHFRARFLQDQSVTPSRIRSTTELSVVEFIRYIDKIVQFVGQTLGITLEGQREF